MRELLDAFDTLYWRLLENRGNLDKDERQQLEALKKAREDMGIVY